MTLRLSAVTRAHYHRPRAAAASVLLRACEAGDGDVITRAGIWRIIIPDSSHPIARSNTMLVMKPPMSHRALLPTDSGALVHLGGKLAIVAVSPQDPQRRLQLAVFDAASGIFGRGIYEGGDVIVFGPELVFEPDLTSADMSMLPGQGPGSAVYLRGDDVHIVMNLARGRESTHRFVNLRTGIISAADSQVNCGFCRWRLGCKGPEDQLTWLLTVAPPEKWSL
jgi:hypothetical protein